MLRWVWMTLFSSFIFYIILYRHCFNIIIKCSLNLAAVVIDKSFFDNKADYRDIVKNIYSFITAITREKIHMADIDVHIFEGTKGHNFRGKNENILDKYNIIAII